MSADEKGVIEVSKNGPYIVKHLKSIKGLKDGKEYGGAAATALCRCGDSKKKPYCDGSHVVNGFKGDKAADHVADKRENYEGKGITIHDNRGICAHAGMCTDNLKEVFRLKTEPWIDPAGAPVEKIIETIKKCPSGALSYTVGGNEYRNREAVEPCVLVAPKGPYVIKGGVVLQDVEKGEGASDEHYDLCRCGASKNKPFCSGAHWYKKFDENASN